MAYEQDFLSVALLGQLSHEHAPGAQEQTSPHLFISHLDSEGRRR